MGILCPYIFSRPDLKIYNQRIVNKRLNVCYMPRRCSTARQCVRRCRQRSPPTPRNTPTLLFLMPLRSPAAMFRRGWTKAALAAPRLCSWGMRARPARPRGSNRRRRRRSSARREPVPANSCSVLPAIPPSLNESTAHKRQSKSASIEYLSSLHGIGGQLRGNA